MNGGNLGCRPLSINSKYLSIVPAEATLIEAVNAWYELYRLGGSPQFAQKTGNARFTDHNYFIA
jgi:hypothetical protein